VVDHAAYRVWPITVADPQGEGDRRPLPYWSLEISTNSADIFISILGKRGTGGAMRGYEREVISQCVRFPY